MPTISSSYVPAPKSWDEFEEITLSASKIRWRSLRFFRNGRQGQAQNGVDVWGTCSFGCNIGVQCKNTIGGVSLLVVQNEIANATKFLPALSELYIATTAPRDANIQESVRKISRTRASNALFSVDILFWDDIIGDLAGDENIFFKHYPQFSSLKKHSISDDIIRQRMFINHVGPLIDYLRSMGGEIAHRIKDSPLDQLSEIADNWPVTNLRSWSINIATQQDAMANLFGDIRGMYIANDYHDTGSGIIFTWKEDQRHNASLNDKKKFAEAKIREILDILANLQHAACA